MTHPTAEPAVIPEWLTFDDANALRSEIWPSTSERDASGAITVGGVSTAKLAAEFGTPVYVIDERDVRSRADGFVAAARAAFEPIGAHTKVYYAGKALLTSHVVRWMLDAGLNIDTCTLGEMELALRSGAPGERIGLHGNNKADAEIARAIEIGAASIVLDSLEEVERVAQEARRQGRRVRVRIRIRSGVHASTHEYLATAREDQKFGVSLTEADDAIAQIRANDDVLDFLGLHSHIGSQITAAEGFEEAARRLLHVHARNLPGGRIPELNLGGGFGIAYREGEQRLEPSEVLPKIAATVESECAVLGIDVPTIVFEPGRIIVGAAGVTLYAAGSTKQVDLDDDQTRRYIAIDGGMSDNARPALYRADYTARVADRAPAGQPVLSRIVGKHCESGDVVVQFSALPEDTRRGDILAVAATGAYCYSLSSNYNYVTRTPIVSVADGVVTQHVRRQTIDELLSYDAGLAPTSSSQSSKHLESTP